MLRKVWRLPNASSCLGFAEKVRLLFRTLKPFWVRFLELPRLTLASASSDRRRWGAVYRDSGRRPGHLPTARGVPEEREKETGDCGRQRGPSRVHPGDNWLPRAAIRGRPLRLAPYRFPLRDPGRLLARGSLAQGAWARPPAPGMRGATCWVYFKKTFFAPSWLHSRVGATQLQGL